MYEEAHMKQLFAFVIAVSIMITGCTSTGFCGLAKETYALEINERQTNLKEEFDQLKKEVKILMELTEELEQLKSLTKDITAKLDVLPEETLRRMVNILTTYLDNRQL
jgi:cell shape-determining protein MreC